MSLKTDDVGCWSRLPSVNRGKSSKERTGSSRKRSDQSALRSLFNQYDRQLDGYMTAEQLREMFNSLRCLDDLSGTSLSLAQAEASIAACCATDSCELSELTYCIEELDRRLEIVRNARWEFEFLDTVGRGLISEEQARFLFQATHNERFSQHQFDTFVRGRPRQGSAISFEEIELELCNVPTLHAVLKEQEDAVKKDQAREAKAKLQASIRQAEEEHRDMSLRLAAAARADNERRERKARKEAQRKAQAKEDEDHRRRVAEEERVASHMRDRNKKFDEQSRLRTEAAEARERRQQLIQDQQAKELADQTAKEEAEKKAAERARQRKLQQQQDKEEEEKRRAEAAAREKAAEEERQRQIEEERRAKEKAEAEERAKRHAEEEAKDAAKREAEALSEAKAAAAALAGAKDEESKAAALERQKKAKKRAKEETEKRVRGDLKTAIKSRKIEKLEPAINEAVSIKPKKEEWPELTEAEQLLKQLRAAMDLKGALTERKLQALMEARRKVNQSGCASELAKELAEANSLISKLEKLAKQKKEIMDMKASVISELRSYSNPPPAVHKVLTATFLILGVKERELKNWQTIQALMGKTGKESLKRRVSECEPQNITVDVIQRVQRVTHGLDVVSVGEISSTAATFALWVETMIEEAESLQKK